MPTFPVKKYGGSLTNNLQQSRAAAELMTEYLQRLEAVGIKTGEGACFDEIVCTSLEQSESVNHIFRELCLEHGLKMKEN